MIDGDGIEIERVWLLRSMPVVPMGVERWQVEQGYLPGHDHLSEETVVPEFREGRIRRVHSSDGSFLCTHTIKRGAGMVRQESERQISPEEFDRVWPSTVHRRISKTRYRVRDGDLVWELDEFHSLPLVMLEVELPSTATDVVLPEWTRGLIDREVTFDPRYRNAALAIDGLPR